MTLKEVSSVIDDINEWENPRGGSVFYVTAIFTDESVGSVGRKNHDAALEVQGLLRESIGVEQDFTLEPAGQTKTGREKFKIKGFGTPGGAATYTAPGNVQGTSGDPSPNRTRQSGRPPEHDVDASIRAAVALKAAATVFAGTGNFEETLHIADGLFNSWLAKKASEPASSAYAPRVDDASTSTSPAGAGSEDREEGVESEGKEPAPSSHEGIEVAPRAHVPEGIDPPSPVEAMHIHDWQPHPNLRGKLACSCGEMRNKAGLEGQI